MSKRNLRSLEKLADEEQGLYINIRRDRIRKQNEAIGRQKEKNLLNKYTNNNKKKSKKFDYFKWITTNNIYDYSDKSKNSHFDNLSQDIVQEFEQLNKQKFNVGNIVYKKLSDILSGSLSLKAKLAEVETLYAGNNTERAQKEVTRFILNQHVYKIKLFANTNIVEYSEEDFKLKFWSHIFEEIFGYSEIKLKWNGIPIVITTDYILYRGDTVPISLTKNNAISKMDLRVTANLAPLDYSLIEFAKECTSRKYYLDKLKLVLVSKIHLNSLVKNLQCKQIELFVPFMQIMGFDCHLLHLVLVKPKQYMLFNVITFSYPITKKQVDEGGIERLINVLSYIKESALELEAQIDNARTEKHVSKINGLLDTSTPAESPSPYWGTKVIWPDKSILEDNSKWENNSEEEKEEEDEEEEDDDEEEEYDDEEEENEEENEEEDEEEENEEDNEDQINI